MIAQSVRHAARALGDIQQVLHGTGRGEWRGQAAEKFRDQFDNDFRPKIDKAEDSFGRSASALEDWADYMIPKQRRARDLESQAEAAKKRAEDARSAADGLPGKPPPWDQPKDKEEEKQREQLEERRGKAEQAAVDAEEALEEILRAARRLAESYREKGEEIELHPVS
ncbi:putative T7SS-secreted protein [Streptomyces boninensis]|uniref:putative T7SS-secreted protein n=1 Tax=Streptomyces boninensis TaxID=2039455 RepID=UPI003B2265DF